MLEFKFIYGADGLDASKKIRTDIFQKELSFSEINDQHDEVAWHIIAYEKGEVIAAARMWQRHEGIFSIDFLGVLKNYRLQYIGDTILRALEDKAVQLKGYLIETAITPDTAQFFLKEGYEEDGNLMRKDLTKPFKRCKNCRQ